MSESQNTPDSRRFDGAAGSAKYRRRVARWHKRLSLALAILSSEEAKQMVETVAHHMKGASIFWDESERQVEIVGNEFEVIVRQHPQSPNTPAQPRREEGQQ